MGHEDLGKKLQQQQIQARKALIHEIGISMASFIAEIDSDSATVAAYIEQRLMPLTALHAVDYRAKQVLEQIAKDGRKLVK